MSRGRRRRRREPGEWGERLWCGCRVRPDGSVRHRGTPECDQVAAASKLGPAHSRPIGGSVTHIIGSEATGTELGNEPCSCGSLTGPLMAGYLRLVDEDASEEELQAWVVDSPLSVAEMQAGIEAMSNPGTPVAWFCEHGRLQTMLFGEGPPPDLADVG